MCVIAALMGRYNRRARVIRRRRVSCILGKPWSLWLAVYRTRSWRCPQSTHAAPGDGTSFDAPGNSQRSARPHCLHLSHGGLSSWMHFCLADRHDTHATGLRILAMLERCQTWTARWATLPRSLFPVAICPPHPVPAHHSALGPAVPSQLHGLPTSFHRITSTTAIMMPCSTRRLDKPSSRKSSNLPLSCLLSRTIISCFFYSLDQLEYTIILFQGYTSTPTNSHKSCKSTSSIWVGRVALSSPNMFLPHINTSSNGYYIHPIGET
jgi:hypothetical protein